MQQKIVLAVLVLAQIILQICAQAPRAIQLDIEPYALSQWNTNKQQTANEFLDLLDKLSALKPPVPLRYAIPRWFEVHLITRTGSTVARPLHALVLDRGHVMVMDYVNSGSRAIADAKEEISYASSVGKGVVLALETMQLPIEPTATFYGQTPQALEQALTEIHNAYNGKNASFEAVCVHHYTSWKTFVGNNFGRWNYTTMGPKRDLYLWDNAYVLQASKRAELFADLQLMQAPTGGNKVRRIYLESNTLVSSTRHWTNLTSFINELYTKFGIELELLSGDHNWALVGQHMDAIKFVNNSINYMASAWPVKPATSGQSPGATNSTKVVSEASNRAQICTILYIVALLVAILIIQ